MGNINWEKFGEEISKTVQDAVENQNYDKLNQMITNTVNQTVNTLGSGVKAVFNASQSKYQEHRSYQEKTSYSAYKTYTTDREKDQRTTPSPKRTSGMKYSNVREESSIVKTTTIPSKIPSKMGTVILAAVGYIFGASHLLAFILLLIASILIGDLGALIVGIFTTLCAGAISAAGFALGIKQTKKFYRIERFKKYTAIIGKKEYCNISDLSEKSGETVKNVIKDIEYMIKKHWFLQGHLDKQKTCLMITDKMYDQYCQLEKQKAIEQREIKEQQEKQKKLQEEKIAAGKMLSPEVQRVIEQGDEYIKKIRECNDAIPGEEISAKIYRIEMLVDKIFDRVEQHPKSVTDIRKLMEYYLPTTVKLLDAYAEMDAQPAGGENIQSAKKEIEATLDTLNVAFEKLLDSMFQETAWDVSSDISVLNTMLAQEGLKEDGLKRK